MTDAELIGNFETGDMYAFNDLVDRWQKRIYNFSYQYFGSHDEAMDITQKTFIRVYHNLNSLDNNQAFDTWIYRITKNLCLDESKRAGRRRLSSIHDLHEEAFETTSNGKPGKNLQQKQISVMLHRALSQLPPEQRIVVIMKEYEELKFREIAEILDEPENTVKSRLYYGLKKLRQLFDEWNIEPEVWYHE